MKGFMLGFLAVGGVALDVKVANTGGNATSGLQYGIMFEVGVPIVLTFAAIWYSWSASQDINHSGDGGIYAELIRNRAFQGDSVFPSTISPWTSVGDAKLSLQNLSQPLSSALPTSLNVAATDGVVGISNPGYWGIEVKVQKYTGSFWVKGNYNGSFTAKLYNYLSNETVGSVEVASNATATEWREHSFTLTPKKDAGVNNTFQVTYDASVRLLRKRSCRI